MRTKIKCTILVAAFCFAGVSALSAQTENKSEAVDSAPVVNDQQSVVNDSQPHAESVASQSVKKTVDGEIEDEPTVGVAQASGLTGDATAALRNAGAQQKLSGAITNVGIDNRSKRFAVTFNDLKFEMKKAEKFDRRMLTEKIKGFHGGKVKIRGYIRPNYKQSGITKFIFVRDNKECCFGPQAAIFDNILVKLARNKSTNYTVRPVTIEGNFVLKEYLGPDGNVWSLYRMYDAQIK